MNKNFFLCGKIIILLLCALLSTSLSAQFVEPKFDVITPVIVPACVFQDSYGFIWIGDQAGLVKYDGYNLKRYSQIPFDSTSLSNNWVMTIKEDKKGNLWIGTQGGGLDYFDQRTETFTCFLQDKNDSRSAGMNTILKILVNDDGSLWLGTQDQGLVYIRIDSIGNAIYNNYDLNIVPNPTVPTGDNTVSDLYKDKQGKIWIGTNGGGLKLFDPLTEAITHFRHDPNNPNSISSNIVNSICEDDSGNLWIGTGYGLNKFDLNKGQFIHYNHNPEDPTSLCSNYITSLVIDKESILWIGTSANYVNSISIADLLSDKNSHFH